MNYTKFQMSTLQNFKQSWFLLAYLFYWSAFDKLLRV